MTAPTAEPHESLEAAYATNYDYLDSNPPQYHHHYHQPLYRPHPHPHPHPQQQHQHQHQQQHHHHHQYYPSASSNAPGTSSCSASSSHQPLSRGGGSVGSSGSQSYYSSATTPPPPPPPQQQQQQQPHLSQYPQYHQYHQHHHHPSPPTGAYRTHRHASSNYPEHAHSTALNPAPAAAYLSAAPAISSDMYSQSNISMPALGPPASDPSVTAPPLADDLGDSFANMNLYGTPRLGPQRSNTPAYHAPTPIPSDASSTKRVATVASVPANAMYANQQIHQSASEVQPENSLAAIADHVDQAAADLDPHATASATASSQNDHSSQHGGGSGGVRQHSAPGEHPVAAPYPAFQPQALHHASAGYPFAPAGGASAYESNPYFAAASGYLGFPEGAAPGFPPGADPYAGGVPAMMGMMGAGGGARPTMLSRQGTQMSMMSANSGSLGGMASSNPHRKSKDSAPQQTLPFNKSFVAEYRQRMKGDPDAEAQFAYAKYLIEAAKKVHDPADGPKQQRKYRDTLLSESLKLIKRLATTGMGLGKPPYAESQFFLANCFGNGSLGLQVDHEKAYNLYVQASKQNHPAATYRTAVCNEVGAGTRRDHHRAVLFYRKASALGDTAGMYKLGMVLLNGMLGQPRNVREAIVWLKRAAAQADEDNPHALHELGLLHEKPTSGVVLHDEAYARQLFTQAAQLGYSPSQFKLGSAYEYGNLTCAVDPRRSIAWYTKAAQKGDGESELALSGWYLTGSEGVLKQSDSEAYLWARRAATKGIPKAEYAVGYYSEVGIGVNANLDEAKRWYMRAAAQGNKRAMQRLTELKKLKGASGKKGARPTRKDAESECTVM